VVVDGTVLTRVNGIPSGFGLQGRSALKSLLQLTFYVECSVRINTKLIDMNAITYTSVRNNLAKILEKVCDDHDPVIVTRQNQNSVVIMSLEDYESLTETAYLLRSPKNAQRLIRSIADLDSGKGKQRELVE